MVELAIESPSARTRLALGGLLAALVAQGATAQRSDELDAFREAFRPSKSPASALEPRARALEGLEDDTPAVAAALLDASIALEDECVRIEEQRRRTIFGAAEPDIPLQRREVLDPLRELQRSLRWRLLELENERAIESMVERALEDAQLPFSLRLALAERAGEIEERFLSRARTRLERKDVGEACAALTALLSCDERPERTLSIVIKRLSHESALVRELAARVLSDFPRPESVRALVRRLGVEEGRTRERIARALERLTGQRLGDRASTWEAWWKENEDDVMEGRYELRRGADTGDARPAEQWRYHDVAVDGEAVVFVFDVSDSMKEAMREDPDEEGEPPTRIDYAKTELVAALGALPTGSRFNIVVFSTGAFRYEGRMVTASTRSIAAAQAWVRELALGGGTALYDAIDLAFVTGGRPLRDEPWEAEFGTLLVLTDGLPTRPRAEGTHRAFEKDSFEALLAAVERWNPLDRVVVNVVGLGYALPARYLRELAETGGGRFVQEQ